MTFRASKKHKAQESTKSAKNALKLVSRFQRFLNTGVASRKDLRDIDERFASQISQQGDRILTLLDQLREVAPKSHGQDLLDRTCEVWAKWLSDSDSKENVGYGNLKFSEEISDETQRLLLEGVVDAETHLFQTLLAFKAALSYFLKNPETMEVRNSAEIMGSAKEIIETYLSRQRMLAKIAGSRR